MASGRKNEALMESIVSLARRRGFIYQGSEVYGGLSGTWDYGPLGVALKRNIMQLWWRMFVDEREDMYGIDAAILMNQKVWQASGHVDTFTDPLVECQECHSRFRVDHLLKSYKEAYDRYIQQRSDEIAAKQMELTKQHEALQTELDGYMTDDGLLDYEKLHTEKPDVWKKLYDLEAPQESLNDERTQLATLSGEAVRLFLDDQIKCLVCGQKTWGEPRQFNMMFKTHVGPVADESAVSYLRPETAQGIFTNYKNVIDALYPDLPFGLAQQGKAFRNEISPRDFIFRVRELEQMEIEYFVRPDKWEEAFEHWREQVLRWTDALGLPRESVHELEVPEEDRAHYSKRTIDFEFDFPIGREELSGLAYRTDFDLMNIQKASGKSMEYTVKGTNEKFVPHVIEPSFGVERALMAVLSSAYQEDEVNGEKRVYMKFPERLAPVRYAVFPLLKNKPELIAKARAVYEALKKKHGNVMWDDNGNIGKRYRRQDEIGTPYTVTIDFQSLEDDTVTTRSRDTTEQRRVTVTELIKTL